MGLLLLLSCTILSIFPVTGDSAYHDPNCAENRAAIVHLFQWKWSDVAAECERFLGPMGFCGVQVSPPTEHALYYELGRPWWERMQPVSYILVSASGNEEEFADMVERCNRVDVRIYVETIIQHMTDSGASGIGSAGSTFDGPNWSYPGVPYSADNFNDCSTCPECCCIEDETDHTESRDCQLVGLIDLKPSHPDTADKIVDFLNTCIDMGAAGFLISAAKHMWPTDIEHIMNRTHDLTEEFFSEGARSFIYMEVIDMNNPGEIIAKEYVHLGLITEYRFCYQVKDATAELWKIPNIYDAEWGMVDSDDALVFVDNQDNQRGHWFEEEVLTHMEPREYQIATAINLGYDYGYPNIMSSYYFNDTDIGPPADDDYKGNSWEWYTINHNDGGRFPGFEERVTG